MESKQRLGWDGEAGGLTEDQSMVMAEKPVAVPKWSLLLFFWSLVRDTGSPFLLLRNGPLVLYC